MPTDIVIDEDLMAQTMLATGLQTESETVELALRTLLQMRRQAEIRKLRGKLNWEGDLEDMRTDG